MKTLEGVLSPSSEHADTMFKPSSKRGSGVSDRKLYDVCRRENRCLVTLDLDFADPTQFAPKETGGIVVIRVPRNPSLMLLERLIEQFLDLLNREPFARDLWIVEVGRVRVHQANDI